MRAPPLAIPLLAALSACGTGLYDASGLPLVPGGSLCGAGQVLCANVCTAESPSQCGATCQDCTNAGLPPVNGAWACLPGGACGFECLDGFLRCGDACCPTTALAAGAAFTCARLSDGGGGAVRCWGANESGQLGDGSTIRRPAPVAVPLAAGAAAVGVGEHHACAVVPGGAVRCWGANDFGQVGVAPVSPVLTPSTTAITAGATAIVGGAAHTCALLSGGAVKCWGRNDRGQLGGTPDGAGVATPVSTGATAIAAGSRHTCAVVAGAVTCWGANDAGQLGDGSTADPGTGVLVTPIASGIVAVSASQAQTCATTGVSNGTALDDVVRCWGSGLGSTFGLGAPQPTPAIPLKQAGQATVRFAISGLAVGRAHACVQRSGELAYCLGADDSRGQLGAPAIPTGSSEAWPVAGNLTTAAMAAGADHACAALADGRVRCWGANADGQLGNGATADPGNGVVVAPSGR